MRPETCIHSGSANSVAVWYRAKGLPPCPIRKREVSNARSDVGSKVVEAVGFSGTRILRKSLVHKAIYSL